MEKKKETIEEGIRNALEEIERTKSISREVIIDAFKDSMVRAYRKSLAKGGVKVVDDADVRAVVDFEKGTIAVQHVYQVVDEVTDDFLQKSVDELNEGKNKDKYNVGDEYIETYDFKSLNSTIQLNFANFFRQKISEAEKGLLYNAFKDKVGTMLIGRVESCSEYGATVKINNATLDLKRKDMIGDEMFAKGDSIRLYVSKVNATGSKNQQQIEVSRADKGFLRALFFEEINEIANGNIIIKAIARKAGERSKVAVYSLDPNIDPAGSCIGQNGIRVQRIVGQLGNNTSESEKVDVITWSDNPYVFIAEAMKPCRVAGLVVDEEQKIATAIVAPENLPLAIGRKGVNITLAKQLTGYMILVNTIDDAKEEELEYTPIEEIESLAAELKAKRVNELQNKIKEAIPSSLPNLPEDYVRPEERNYEKEDNTFDMTFKEADEKEELDNINIANETPAAPASKEEKPEAKETVKVTVNTSGASLADFEASLEQESNKTKNKSNNKKKRKEDENKDDAITHTSTVDPSAYMSVYDDEEELDEDNQEYEDDTDLDEEYIDYEDNY